LETDDVAVASHIRAALESRIRRVTLILFIRRRDAWLLLSEICHDTGLAANQVIGAVRGIQGQYDPKLSLLNLKIVQQKELQTSSKRTRKLYKLNRISERNFELIEAILSRYKRAGEP
jgi:predicted transcriptional regulator with HTH domain